MNDLPDEVERFNKRLEALERRVAALEHPLAARWPPRSPELEQSPAQPTDKAAALAPAGAFGVLGRALLGVAGAYVLRAAEEASSLPRPAVAWVGIAYAFLWLVLAARLRGRQQFARTVYSVTSALILAPMLWELTLRFKVIPVSLAACVLCLYAVAAVGLTWKRDWKRDLAPVVRMGAIAPAGLALALALASHRMMPFIVALLILAAMSEFVPTAGRVPEIRALAALATDASIWILVYVYFSPQPAGEDYPVLGRAELLSPCVALFVLYAASISWKTILRARPITAFETAQTTIAFLLAAVSVADFGPAGNTMILGIVCLVLSAAICTAVFTVFKRTAERGNAAVFAAWGVALLLAGSFLCLPALALAAVLGAAAVAATILGRRRNQLAWEFYGMVFLLAAASASGLLMFVVDALAGMPPGAPAASIWLAAGFAILCYAAAKPRENEAWKPRVLHLGFAALAVGTVAAMLVWGLVGLTALLVQPGAHHLAVIRTLTLCATSLTLVYGGAHWRRIELTRLGYAALALVAVKLVTEDLRHGHLGYIATSIFLVALTLIAAPRMARARQKA